MKSLGKKTFVAVSLAGALTTLAAAGAIAKSTPASQLAPSQPALSFVHHRAVCDAHDQMSKALAKLQDAREALRAADRDYHGHRMNALGYTNQAIDEIHQAIG